MSEISINTVENNDEIDQIILLTTCTTQLHRYYRVTLLFLDFHQNKKKSENFPSPFYYLHESTEENLFKQNRYSKNILILKVLSPFLTATRAKNMATLALRILDLLK